jgi:hypothetical protein
LLPRLAAQKERSTERDVARSITKHIICGNNIVITKVRIPKSKKPGYLSGLLQKVRA